MSVVQWTGDRRRHAGTWMRVGVVDGIRVEVSERWLRALAMTMALGPAEAARRLGVNQQTVAKYRSALYAELEVANEGETPWTSMHRAAIALGWIDVPPELLEPWRRRRHVPYLERTDRLVRRFGFRQDDNDRLARLIAGDRP